MPPKKPPLAGSRRTVAMGSYHILFSSPIPPRDPSAEGRQAKRDKSVPRPAAPTSAPVPGADYRHVESKVKALIRSHSSAGREPSASLLSRVPRPPSPPAPLQRPAYEAITDETQLATEDAGREPGHLPDAATTSAVAERLSAARVTRLLKHARAAVQAPFRPETPVELLRPTTDRAREDFLKGRVGGAGGSAAGGGRLMSGAAARRGRYGAPGSGDTHRHGAGGSSGSVGSGGAAAGLRAPSGKGQRLSSLSPLSVALRVEGSGGMHSPSRDRALGAPSSLESLLSRSLPPALHLLLSSRLSASGLSGGGGGLTISAMNPDCFLDCLVDAEGDATRQMALLRELARWCMHPQHVLRPAWVEYFTRAISVCNSADAGSAHGEDADAVAVAAVMSVLFLRNSTQQVGEAVPLAEVALLLRKLTTAAPPPHVLMPSTSFAAAAAARDAGSEESRAQQPHRLQQDQAATTAAAVMGWLAQELAFEPLLRLLGSEWVLEQQPHIAADILAMLRNCTSASQAAPGCPLPPPLPASRSPGSGSPLMAEWAEELWAPHAVDGGDGDERGTAAASFSSTFTPAGPAVSQHLVTLGAIPTLNTVAQRLLSLMEGAMAAQQRNGGVEEKGRSLMAYLPQLLSSVCLLFRDLSTHFSHHLLQLGILPLLLSVLERTAPAAQSPLSTATTAIAAAVARALAKLIFDPACLQVFRQDTRLLQAALGALSSQLPLYTGSAGSSRGSSGELSSGRGRGRHGDGCEHRAQQETHFFLLVSRLCSVMAEVAEGCEAQQQFLVQHGTRVELSLLSGFVSPSNLSALPAQEESSSPLPPPQADVGGAGHQSTVAGEGEDSPHSRDGVLTVVQSVVWLVGVTAMGKSLPLPFVEEAATQLTVFLQEMPPTSARTRSHEGRQLRLVKIYALMCLSNLSFLFPAIEARSDSGAIFLQELYSSLGLVLASVLVDGDVEATVEATRTLGNMSFTNAGRDWMESSKCDEVVLLFLGHEDLRVVYNSFGVMLNLTAATSCRVVEDGELLRMMLQYTGRFTNRKAIDEAAREGERALVRLSGSDVSVSNVGEVAQDYAEQVADLVEKCLANVRGLLEAHQQQQQQQQVSGTASTDGL